MRTGQKKWHPVFIIFIILLAAYASAAAKQEKNGNSDEQKIFKQAVVLYGKGLLQEAEKLLKGLESQSTQNPDVYFYLALTYYDLKDLEKAEDYCLKSLKIDENQSKVYSELSAIKLNQKKYSEAETYALKAVQLDPKNGRAHLNYSSILMMLGKEEESEQQLIETAKVAPDVLMNLANQYLTQHKNPRVALYLLSILESVYDSDPMILLNMGNIFRMVRLNDKAIEYLEKAYHAAENQHEMFPVIYASYFRTLLDHEKYNEIIDHVFDKIEKNVSLGYFFLALTYYKQKNMPLFEKNAKKYFELENEKAPASLEEWAEEKCKSHD